ncbi:MAG: transposase [Candidatus Binatia bacterium]
MPHALRYRLAYDRKLVTPVLGAFVRAVSASLRRRARDQHGVRRAKCGAVTFLQRFGGALNLNVHFHSLFLDGVYEVLPRGAGIRFIALPSPDAQEVARVLADTTARVVRALAAAGYEVDPDLGDEDALAREHPVLAAIYEAAVRGRVAAGTQPGQPVIRLGRPSKAETLSPPSISPAAVLGGFSLHAGVAMAAGDRGGLERLCRYVARPPLAEQRLEELADGRIVYRLRHRWRDGTSAVVLEPRDLLARLAAQIPPPRMHQVCYHGVLGPCALWRRYVAPSAGRVTAAAPVPCGQRPEACGRTDSPPGTRDPSSAGRARRMAWSELLRRVFAVDALRCQRCGGAMRIVAAVCEPHAVAAFLACIRKGAGRSPPCFAGYGSRVLPHYSGGDGKRPRLGRSAKSIGSIPRRTGVSAVTSKAEKDRSGTLKWPVPGVVTVRCDAARGPGRGREV